MQVHPPPGECSETPDFIGVSTKLSPIRPWAPNARYPIEFIDRCARFFPTADIKGFAANNATEKGAATFIEPSSRRRYSRQQRGHGEPSPFSTDRRRLAGSLRDQRDERGPDDPPLFSGDDQARLGAHRLHQQRVRTGDPERDDRLRHDEDRPARDRPGVAESVAGTGVTVNSVLPGPRTPKSCQTG